MSDFAEYLAENGRLIILKELAMQQGGTLNESLLLKVLDTFGHRQSREWLRAQMQYLAATGAIDITEAGTVMIGRLRRKGREHVEGRIALKGVQTPSEV